MCGLHAWSKLNKQLQFVNQVCIIEKPHNDSYLQKVLTENHLAS